MQEGIFHSITHHNQIWQPDPYDIDSIHQKSRECFERLLNRISNNEQTDSGRIMLLLGESGAGKTHLMRAFRNYTHEKSLGYFAYMQMTSSVSNYASYALNYTIDSLDKPYCATNSNITGLMHLSNALIEQRQVVSQHTIDQLRSGKLNYNELNQLIFEITDVILNKEKELRFIDIDLIRVLLYLQHDEPAIHARVRKYLRCEHMSEYDSKLLGNIAPRVQEDAPDRLLQALAQLIMAINQGAFIICLDQLEDIHPAKEAEVKFRHTMEKMTKLAEIPNVIVVIAGLEEIYCAQLRNSLPNSLIDRIERDPDTITLRGERNAAEIHAIIRARLGALYDSHDIDFDKNESIFPFQNEVPSLLVGMKTRQIIDWCRQEREYSIHTGNPPRLPDKHSAIPYSPPLTKQTYKEASPSLEQLWNDHLVDQHVVPDNEDEMLQLFKQGVEHCTIELNHAFACNIEQRDNFLDIDIQAATGNSVRNLTIGLCQKSPLGRALAKQIDELKVAAGKRTAIVIRSIEFPANPKTKIAIQLGEFVAEGGKKVLVPDADWRTIIAMKSFQEQYAAHPDFKSWLQKEQPLLSLPSLQEIMSFETSLEESDELSITDSVPSPIAPATSVNVQRLSPTSSQLEIGMTQGYQPSPYQIDASRFVRHAAFLGGSGSGKTTLALNIIEQILLQGIPAILLDRKGDLCSYAQEAAWHHPVADPVRAQRRKDLRDKIEVVVYTPGAIEGQGRPLSIPIVPNGLAHLSSGECDQLANYAAFSLGKMMGYKDYGQDRARIVILGKAISILGQLNESHTLTIDHLLDFIHRDDPLLLNAIGKLDPKLSKKLVQDLQTLALGHKNMFSQSGELLDTENLFGHTSEKTRLSIINTSNLGNNDNILFWVSQLLLDIGRFAKKSPSDKLQGVILLDEADLYLPAQSKPATKEPLENLLRRARSAGIGLMLATQSPGDLDYRSRDQISTWFIGHIKEKTALNKLKPMLSEAKVNISDKLASQSIGEFYAVYNGEVSSIRANRSLIQAEQIPAHDILKLANRKKKDNRLSSFFQNMFANT
jgi:energy-coupling factor transporter ATP-binding protein EcfA2